MRTNVLHAGPARDPLASLPMQQVFDARAAGIGGTSSKTSLPLSNSRAPTATYLPGPSVGSPSPAEEVADGGVEDRLLAPWSLMPAVVGQLESASAQELRKLQGRAGRHDMVREADNHEEIRLGPLCGLVHGAAEGR